MWCFRADLKKKIVSPASDCLSHVRLLLWNYLTEFHETWQEATCKRFLPSLCLIGWARIFDFSSETAEQNSTKLDRKQDSMSSSQFGYFGLLQRIRWPPDLWLADTFLSSPLKLLYIIQRNLIRSKTSTSSTKCVFFGWSENKDDRPV